MRYRCATPAIFGNFFYERTKCVYKTFDRTAKSFSKGTQIIIQLCYGLLIYSRFTKHKHLVIWYKTRTVLPG